jgi:hypothetical protein
MAKIRKQVPNPAINKPNSKQVKVAEQKLNAKPVWRFSTTDKSGPFAWPKGSPKELELVAKLHEFDSMFWSEIEGEHHHLLSESSLSKESKKRLAELKLDDEVDNLFSFHVSGKSRIIAIRHLGVAELLWFDSEHQVCPSRKKHT